VLVIAVCVLLVAAGLVLVARPRAPAPRTGMLRSVGVTLAAGLAACLFAAGAGGRLVMRLLAVTSPDAEGSITEADEVVGDISLDGTVGFIVFAGVPAGLLSGALYALLRPILPAGRAGGAALGALLLVLAGTRIEPLRADNIDFDIVGPAWLAVVAFTALAIFQGMLTVAFAERWSAPPAVSDRVRIAGRIALAAVVLVALPGFVSALSEILG
jgi:hypothetical protein